MATDLGIVKRFAINSPVPFAYFSQGVGFAGWRSLFAQNHLVDFISMGHAANRATQAFGVVLSHTYNPSSALTMGSNRALSSGAADMALPSTARPR